MAPEKHGLEYWRGHLYQAQIPVLSTGEARDTLLLPSATLQQVYRVLNADLPLALDAVVMAARLPRIDGEVQGLQHALNVLGTDKVQSLVRTRMKRPFDAGRPAHRACLQAIATSRLAAALVESWEWPNPGGNGEYLQWVALLLGLARWKLPLVAPEVHLQIERRARAGEHRARVERELLGCSIDELNAAVARDIGLPADAMLLRAITPDSHMLAASAACAWAASMAPELPVKVARWLRQRTTVSVLAHMLAWSATDGWYSRRTLLLMRVVSAHLNQPLDRVIAGVHQTAVRASRAPEFAGLCFTPAQQLFWPPAPPRSLRARSRPAAADTQAPPAANPAPAQEIARPPAHPAAAPQNAAPGAREVVSYSGFASSDAATGTTPPAVPAAPGASAPAPAPDVDIVEACSQNCQHGRYPDMRAFLLATGQTLEKGLGLQRCLLFLKPPRATQLNCFFAHGWGGAVEARKLSVAAGDENLLARIVSRSGGSLWVTPAKLPAARGQLPEVLKALAPEGGFLLGTLHLQDRPVGVMWADGGAASAALGEQHYAEFRHMIHHFGAEFSRLAAAMRKSGN